MKLNTPAPTPTVQPAPWRHVLAVTRPRFLTLALLSALIGIAAAIPANDAARQWYWPVMIVMGALAAHASVNAFNEVMDAQSGLDDQTIRTPFSGGSGTLQRFPQLLPAAQRLAIGLLLLASAIGLLICIRIGWRIVLIGLPGAALIYFYTRHINRHAWLTLLAPGLGFGPLMIWGACYAMTGHITQQALFAALPVACWVSNVLLLAQIPDAQADARAGRRHLVITHGAEGAVRIYGYLQISSFALIVAGSASGHLPGRCYDLLIALPASLWLWRKLQRSVADLSTAYSSTNDFSAYIPLLGWHIAGTHFLMLALWALLRSAP